MATPTSKPAVTCHTFFLEIDPYPTERTRCACRGNGRRAFPTVYATKDYKDWLADAVEKLGREAEGFDLTSFHDAPIEITIQVVRARPKTSKLYAPLGDNDNYEKGVWDAISKAGHWWADDRQIVRNSTQKRWAEPDEPAGYIIGISVASEEKFSR